MINSIFLFFKRGIFVEKKLLFSMLYPTVHFTQLKQPVLLYIDIHSQNKKYIQ